MCERRGLICIRPHQKEKIKNYKNLSNHNNSVQCIPVEFYEEGLFSPLSYNGENEANIKQSKLLEQDLIGPQDQWQLPDITEKNVNFYNNFPLLSYPQSNLSLNLNAESLRYLDYYTTKYSPIISISPENNNYFLKTFLKVAYYNEPVLYALVSWGCLFDNSYDEAKSWMTKSQRLIKDIKLRDSNDVYLLLCYYLIVVGWEVCAGDINNWYKMMLLALKLIKSQGGIEKIMKLYDNSIDIQWLISDFQFHDVLSSEALQRGTIFPVSEYRLVLHENIEYGVDPLQGCLRPLYLILGEIKNTTVDLKQENERINFEISKEPRNGFSDTKNIRNLRIAHLKRCEEQFHYFEQRIHDCKPDPDLITLVLSDINEFELHMTLFELYSLTSLLYIGMYLQKLPPASQRQQSLLLQSLELIEILIGTKLHVSLTLLILICGIICCTDYDRLQMRNIFNLLLSRYDIGNLPKIIEVIEESWQKNPNGDSVIDWSELVNDKGWFLYVG